MKVEGAMFFQVFKGTSTLSKTLSNKWSELLLSLRLNGVLRFAKIVI